MSCNNINPQYLNAARNAAAARAFQFGFKYHLSAADREDIEQEILLALLERAAKFDPARGAVGTYTGVVSESCARDSLDRLMKDRGRLIFCDGLRVAANDEEPAGFQDSVVPMWSEPRDEHAQSMALMDFETASAVMTKDQFALFEILGEHNDLPDACTASGISTATFYRRVRDLKMHLRMFGFRAAA